MDKKMSDLSESIGTIFRLIDNAEQTGKVDVSIIKHLKNMSSKFAKMGQYWLKIRRGESLEDSFAMYHTARNCGLVLHKMIERFEESPIIGDNPRVATDAATVFPILIDLYTFLEEAKSKPVRTIRNQGFNRTRTLRNIARMVDMLNSEDKDIEAIPAETRKKTFSTFAEHITGAIKEYEGSA